MSFKSIISTTPLQFAVSVRKLSPLYLLVFNMLFSLCYKGKSYKQMRSISYVYVANELNRLYQVQISVRQVRRAVDKIVSLGLIERRTASFKRKYGSKLLPTKQSYYRLLSPPKLPLTP